MSPSRHLYQTIRELPSFCIQADVEDGYAEMLIDVRERKQAFGIEKQLGFHRHTHEGEVVEPHPCLLEFRKDSFYLAH